MLRDWTFQKTFSRLFVYNILFEDSEVDGRYLELDEKSRVLSISAAGCGVASMLRFHPESIDAIDINKHHLALAALKMRAATEISDYARFYDLFGRGWLPRPERSIKQLASTLPGWMQRYWALHHRRFRRSLYLEGLTAKMLLTLRNQLNVDASWLRRIQHLPRDTREQIIRDQFAPLLRHPAIRAVMNSPLQLLALGVNYEQRDKMVEDHGGDVVNFVIEHLVRVATSDVETNWFAWYGIAGEFNHEHPDAVPPYLRREAHRRSIEAPTQTHFHHGNLFDRLEAAGPKSWTHYTFCDAIDWMPKPVQKKLMDEVLRTADDGAIMLWRSVEGEDIVKAHGMEHRLIRMDEESDTASRDDRSRQYKRVDFYRVCA